MAAVKLESCNSTYTELMVFFLFGLIFLEKSLFCDGLRKNFLNEKKLSVVSFSTFCKVCHMESLTIHQVTWTCNSQKYHA